MTILDLFRSVFSRIGVGILLIALLVAGVVAFIVNDMNQHIAAMESLRLVGIPAEGRVIFKTDNREGRVTVYKLEGMYFSDGLQSHDFTLEVDRDTYDLISTGDTVNLVYDPQNPEAMALQFEVETFDAGNYRTMRLNGITSFGSAAAVIALLVVLGVGRDKSRRARAVARL